MTPLTLVLPYYMNGGMLVEQQRIWYYYQQDLKPFFSAIVVDDGSPANPAINVVSKEPLGIASFALYRIDVDVRWNWLACRNLGMAEAQTEWVLITDIDHVVPGKTLRTLITQARNPDHVYRFSRVSMPHLDPYKPHPNSWLMTRKMFDDIGGYDERFSGFYGTDGEFKDRVHATAKAIVLMPDVLVRYPRDVIPDASTTTYGRKEQQDIENVAKIRALRDSTPGWTTMRGTFPWTRLV